MLPALTTGWPCESDSVAGRREGEREGVRGEIREKNTRERGKNLSECEY